MNPLPQTEDPVVDRAVREAAETWRMPATARSAPWLERVERRRGPFRLAADRLVVAAGLAVAATVMLAVVSVWLNAVSTPTPGIGAGSGSPAALSTPGSASPGSTATGSASPGSTATGSASPSSPQTAAPTSLPKLSVLGSPIPSTQLVVSGDGGYHVIDLATGTDRGVIASYSDVPDVTILPDGRGFAVSGTRLAGGIGSGETVHLALKWFDAGLAGSHRVTVGRTLQGIVGSVSDPATGWTATPTASGGRVLLGWTERRADGWHAGVDLLDGASGSVLDTVKLPVVALAQGSDQLIAWAPFVAVSPNGQHLAITYQGGTPSGLVSATGFGRYAAQLAGDHITQLAPMQIGRGTLADVACSDTATLDFVTDDVIAASCQTGSSLILRRVTPTGAPLGDTDVLAAGTGAGTAFAGEARVPGTTQAWFWDPFGRALVHLDLATGAVLARGTISGQASVAPSLFERVAHGLGRWLAPAAAAKFFIDPSIAVSPDGSRVYVIGSAASSFTDVPAGSSGVMVVDASTLALIAQWPPTADYVSIGLSPDGSRLFVLGMPGVGPTGAEAPWEASVTVLDTTTGRPELVAGRLGSGMLLLKRVVEP